jgi:hypothetical protein
VKFAIVSLLNNVPMPALLLIHSGLPACS